LNVGLDFLPVAGGGAAVTPYQVTGDAGIRSVVNGINGQNSIYFKCKITGHPAAQYKARVTITADTSRIEKITDSLVNLMSTQEKVDQLHGNGSRQSADNTRLNIPGYYMTNGPREYALGRPQRLPLFPEGRRLHVLLTRQLLSKWVLRLERKPGPKATIFLKLQ